MVKVKALYIALNKGEITSFNHPMVKVKVDILIISYFR